MLRILLFLWFFGATTTIAQDRLYKYEFVRVVVVVTEVYDFYTWELRTFNDDGSRNWSVSSGGNLEELKLLVKHFNVSSQELVGKTFESPKANPSQAIEFLATQIRWGYTYKKPTQAELLEAAAQKLANMQVPDFSAYFSGDIAEAFTEVSSSDSAFDAFAQRVQTISGGRVRLSKASGEEFKTRIRGIARYAKLTTSERMERIVMGPYGTPIHLDH